MNYTADGDWNIDELESPNDIIINALTLSRDYFIEDLQGGDLERYRSATGNAELQITSDAERSLEEIGSIFESIRLTGIDIDGDRIQLVVEYNFRGIEQSIKIGI